MPELDENNRSEKEKTTELTGKRVNEQESLELIEQIANQVPAIIYLFNISNLTMIWCNQRHQDLIGFDATGMNLENEQGDLMKIYENDQELAMGNIKQWREAKREPGKVMIRLTDSNGDQKYFYTNHHIFKTDKDDKPLWILGIGISINQREHSEHEKRILYSEDIATTYQLMKKISDQELEILNQLSEGHSYKDIAEQMNLSVDGVRYHIRKLYKILEVNNCAKAIKIAMKYRLIQP